MAIHPDPETAGLTKLAFSEKRLVESGRLNLEDATALPDGCHIEGGRVVFPSVGAFPIVLGTLLYVPLVALGMLYVFEVLIRVATSEYVRPSLISYVGVPSFALGLGVAFHWVRDRLKNRYYAILEIGVGMATAAQFAREGEALVRIFAFLAGIRIIVDGTNRFVTFSGIWKPDK